MDAALPRRITRSRAARVARTRAIEQALHALPGPRLPLELIDIVVSYVLQRMVQDLLLEPMEAEEWEAGSALMQVSRAFRACTIRYLQPVWGDRFPAGKRCVRI